MLLWINGPFGGGKTQTAYELRRRLAGSVVCDPEDVGFGLRRMMPRGTSPDFQEFPAWRQGVFEVLDRVLTTRKAPVIAPMTLVEPAYFEEIIDRLRHRGHTVRHVALLAERHTVLRRLNGRAGGRAAELLAGRGAPLRWESFAVTKLDTCLERLAEPEFAEHVWTDGLTVAEVADRVAASAGLGLAPNTDGPLLGRLRRAWTSATHIRLG
ncbi:AAA family ATPase [Spiractinospora alimapuensis]|uniref:AAA family ATPase n=1 Tax=Spiractinospora alimapuensis TaxID=2820884 RepID=UPI001F2EB43D|nr:AAA family ATPase [Spiractinospora alimapuensis]QVQ49991.1 AAA family ATPase [Spiractinospora alimapuensis]